MRPSLAKKVEEADKLIEVQTEKHGGASCVLCSFGKDSMVLLYLFILRGDVPPVVFFRDPWFPHKYDFAQSVMSKWGIGIYDYPPIRMSMLYGKGIPAFVNEYHTGEIATIAVPKNIIEYEDSSPGKYMCGLNFFTRPVGTFTFPWKLAFLGHKDCDEDQIYGPVPLKSEILYRDVGPNYCYPLKNWTDNDVWDFTEFHQLPIQESRYDRKNRCEWPDKTFNSDYFPACIRCLDKRLVGRKVFCPALRKEIPNVSELVTEFSWKPDYFGEAYARK